MRDTDELFALVRAQAATIAELPQGEQEGALATLHGKHERSGMDAGMTREAAVGMANRLDTWVREVLRLRPETNAQPETLH